MHNWDYPKTIEAEPHNEKWRMERLLTFGLTNEKIDRVALERNFHSLAMPDDTRAFLELLLWDRVF